MSLLDKEILLGVTGGIACYKTLEVVSMIRKQGGLTSVVMTQSAQEFVTSLSFQTISARKVHTEFFSLAEPCDVDHIALAEKADVMLIAPATAHIIAKLAYGLSDDLLSTIQLACKAPLIIAPAMNSHMWEHPATQHNLSILKSRGTYIIPPESGLLACGTFGPGRMAEPETILSRLNQLVSSSRVGKQKGPLNNIDVLITAGPTQEKIDAVRYISNFSSGKMGYALAEVCEQMGGKVCLISGPTALTPPVNIEVIHVKSAMEMREKVLEQSRRAQLIIKAAAVADYRVEKPAAQKVKKSQELSLSLIQNPDILKELGSAKRDDQYLVGFAAESQNLEMYARKKLEEKHLDLIVANNITQPGAGFHSDTNQVKLFTRELDFDIPQKSKREVAQEIVQYILRDKKWAKIITNHG